MVNETITPDQVHNAADTAGIPWDNDEAFMDFSERVTGIRHIDDMSPQLRKKLIDAIRETS